MLCTISKGRKKDGKNPFNSYYICNTDEPYAEAIHGVIIGGEAVKEQSLSNKQSSKALHKQCLLFCKIIIYQRFSLHCFLSYLFYNILNMGG